MKMRMRIAMRKKVVLLSSLLMLFTYLCVNSIYSEAATVRTTTKDSSYGFVDTDGAICAVTMHLTLTQKYSKGSSATTYTTRTAYLGYESVGSTSPNFLNI